MADPIISVIITTKNEEKNISNCLASIRQQTYPQERIEIVVVDNQSTDKTKEFAKKYTDKVFDKGPERSAQRNYGVEQAQGEYVLYLDADMILDAKVIEECVNVVRKNSQIGGLYIPEIIMGMNFWCKVRRFERSFYNGTVVDCIRFVKKDIFNKVGGFDLTMTGPEDWDFDKKVRRISQVALITAKIHHNETEFDLKKYLAKKTYYIKSIDKYIEKWGKEDADIKKQVGFYYRFVGVFIEKGKWQKLVLRPVLTLGMYYLRFRVGCNYLSRQIKMEA